MSSPKHGGDVTGAEAAYGAPADGWLDLSTGINRIPYPVPAIAPEMWQRLPLGGELERLHVAARACYQAPQACAVVAAPGTQAIIQWLPRLRKPGSVAVVGPTYAEHAHCWRRAGHTVRDIDSLDDATGADVIVVVNPNNPDGWQLHPATLTACADRLAKRGGLLVIDEAFGDVAMDKSMLPSAPHPAVVVLRSLGKFFGLAGLRLGFAFGEAMLMEKLSDALGPWAVSGPALEIGRRALDDDEWQAATRDRLAKDAKRLDNLLTDGGFLIVGGTDLFRLTQHAEAAKVAEYLARRGILIRTFDRCPDWVRFGLPGAEAEWARLKDALGS